MAAVKKSALIVKHLHFHPHCCAHLKQTLVGLSALRSRSDVEPCGTGPPLTGCRGNEACPEECRNGKAAHINSNTAPNRYIMDVLPGSGDCEYANGGDAVGALEASWGVASCFSPLVKRSSSSRSTTRTSSLLRNRTPGEGRFRPEEPEIDVERRAGGSESKSSRPTS